MGVLFESILLFSLAVLIILVGLLVYYFKKRIVEIEQKNAKCLEIAQDVYMQQIQLKKEVFSILFQQPQPQYPVDEKIHVELSEESESESESDESESDESESDESEDEKSVSDTKIVNVNLTFPEECEINIDDEESDDNEIIDEPEPEIVSLEPEPIIVNKVESVTKEELQKMTPASLKSLLISRGVSADAVSKLKKKELIDMLM